MLQTDILKINISVLIRLSCQIILTSSINLILRVVLILCHHKAIINQCGLALPHTGEVKLLGLEILVSKLQKSSALCPKQMVIQGMDLLLTIKRKLTGQLN